MPQQPMLQGRRRKGRPLWLFLSVGFIVPISVSISFSLIQGNFNVIENLFVNFQLNQSPGTTTQKEYLADRVLRSAGVEILGRARILLDQVSFVDQKALEICEGGGSFPLETVKKKVAVGPYPAKFLPHNYIEGMENLMLINFIHIEKHIPSALSLPSDLREQLWASIDAAIKEEPLGFYQQLGLPCAAIKSGRMSVSETQGQRWKNLNIAKKALARLSKKLGYL